MAWCVAYGAPGVDPAGHLEKSTRAEPMAVNLTFLVAVAAAGIFKSFSFILYSSA